jgi:ketosteroid isomerase-like protein
MRRGAWFLAGCVLAFAAYFSAACERATGDPQAEVSAMLARSTADWNRGDLAGFMSDYAPDSSLSYVSGRGVQYGWQPLFDRYQRVYFAPGAARDSLTFTDLAVRSLDDDLALATARFQLTRGDSVVASGPFTLVLEKRGARWLIVHDHTSSDPKP